MTFSVKQDIGGLDVPMDEAFTVNEIHRACNVREPVSECFRCHRPVAQTILKAAALQILHYSKWEPIMLAHIRDLHDVRSIAAARRHGTLKCNCDYPRRSVSSVTGHRLLC